jgi:hypothetical protein
MVDKPFELSKCAKAKYIINNKDIYDFALISRDRKELCGPDAVFYEQMYLK